MPNPETPRHDPAPQSGIAAVGDLNVHYLDWGGEGEPLLALHGLASSGHWYRRVAPFLSHRYRVIAPDQRGHGATTQASAGYDWQTLAEDAVRLMDHFGISRAPALGHSWGGHVASNLAMRFPDRVSRVVMIDGGFQDGGLLPEPTWEAFRQRLAPRLVAGTREEYLGRLAANLSFCWDEDLAEIALTMVHEESDGQMYDNLRPQNHAQVLETMWSEPPSVVLPRITVPALVVAAGPRADRANSQFSRQREVMVAAAEKALPYGRVHWIPDTIHDIGYHKPEELASVILGFLAED
ncbi:MAG: alpha/beta hydrolase [Chloroflexota bacterium]|nr:alpha/beta hydrolase [Chloroflexota bacterium]MDE2961184.1 alpha/beta hydrolase [Chloroflexota bacterium]